MTETTEAPALDLDAIRKRADAATPGPWRTAWPLGMQPWEVYVADDLPAVEMSADERGIADAAFIAHSRADVPALLAEIDRLRRDLSAVEHSKDTAFVYAESEAHRLRRIVRLVTELTHDTDGGDLDPDTDIPVGEVMRALAGESA